MNLFKKPSRVCTIGAPCKINLHLSIGERRPDGFHNLQGIFASLALGDAIRFECYGAEGENKLSVNWGTDCSQETPSGGTSKDAPLIEDNSVFKAVSLFRERTGFKPGLNIRLEKRIPVRAGLGGGSSDAASTLLALNALSEGLCSVSLPMDELKKLALSLGSDVPFFLTGGAAFVSGRGELVEPLKPLDGLWVVLAKPSFSSDTALAYGLLDRFREQMGKENGENAGNVPSKRELILALGGEIEAWPFYNDFLPVLTVTSIVEFAEVNRDILEPLRAFGASFTGLSGAGSCCFGIFYGENEAKKAARKLARQGNFTRLTFFLAHSAIPVLK